MLVVGCGYSVCVCICDMSGWLATAYIAQYVHTTHRVAVCVCACFSSMAAGPKFAISIPSLSFPTSMCTSSYHSTFTPHHHHPSPPPPQIRGKAMGQNSGDLFTLFGDVLTAARLDDRARFTQMVDETKAGLEAGIIGSGHRWGTRLCCAVFCWAVL